MTILENPIWGHHQGQFIQEIDCMEFWNLVVVQDQNHQPQEINLKIREVVCIPYNSKIKKIILSTYILKTPLFKNSTIWFYISQTSIKTNIEKWNNHLLKMIKTLQIFMVITIFQKIHNHT